MNCENITINDASRNDLRDVLDLLSVVQLPHDGVAENVAGFLVARDESGRLVATIGMERHGVIGLLRSAAVAPEYQGCGIGSLLTENSSNGRQKWCGKSRTFDLHGKRIFCASFRLL